ncbi:restriction endonuclease subunit S [Nocardia australiensis]|uniref:restriction endonuclease subunit S n=1 Tax=Nocardia australiensis TaxID=2887191 RepID=UPI001D1332BB|nr:restriction endonuclease subunit S [Nocardia australiensis]
MSLLGEVALIIDCEHKTAPRSDNDAFGYSVGTGAIRDGRIALDKAKPVSRTTFEEWTRRAIPTTGDLILSREAPMGEVGAVPTDSPVCLGQRTVLIRPDASRIATSFLLYALQAPTTQQWIRANSAGSTVQHVNVGDVRKIPLGSLPPVAEQHRIVEILEDHLSRLDAAAISVQTAVRRVEALKLRTLSELYAGPMATLASTSLDAGYGTSEKCAADAPGPAVIRIPNLADGKIDLADEKRVVDPSVDVSKYMVSPGDLLIVRTNGSVDLIGRSAIVQNDVNAAFASYLIRYRLRPDVVRPAWVHAMLRSPQLRSRITSLAASSAGQHNLSLAKLDPLPIPLPSLDMQDAGLERLVEMDALTHRLNRSIVAAQRRAVTLRQSLLAAAFSGRLTWREPWADVTETLVPA